MTGSHSGTAGGWGELAYRGPSQPASVGAIREGLAKRLLPFKGAHFPKRFENVTMIAIVYSESCIFDHVC